MKVVIDAKALGSHTGGDETYMRHLTRALAALDPQGEYVLLLNRSLPEEEFAGIEHMRRIVLREKLFRRIPISIPLTALHERADVLNSQYVRPPLCPVPVVVTIHDISFEHSPEFFTRGDMLHLRALVPPSARGAAAVLTLSEFSKRDIVRRYCVPPDKIVVTPLAADPMFKPVRDPEQLAAVRARYGTGERFVLCVGNLQPRKNLHTLIAAYVKLRQADATRHKLVLVGGKGWLYDDIFAAVRTSGYEDQLVFTDYIPEEDLAPLYSAADLFVFPSLFEGFGLPPLEAMACGTAVVTSNTSSLPEVVGDAGVMVDPRDAEALARAIARVLTDDALRGELATRGERRAATFSWEDTARTILGVYHHAAGR